MVKKGETSNQVDEDIILKFFTKLEENYEEGMGALGDELTKMISDHPGLLEARYDHENFGKKTAAEFFCNSDLNPGSRDMLYDLMVLGAKATDDCYDRIFDDGFSNDFCNCLMISGYMPLEKCGKFFLDEMVDCMEEADYECEEIIQLLSGNVKAGDHFSFGDIEATNVENLKDLPSLEPGVAYEEDGPFHEVLKNYWKENPSDAAEVGDAEDKEKDTEGIHKKQRVK
jgi:hypothetical protein